MDAAGIVERAKALGITLQIAGDRIRYAPRSRTPTDLVEAVRAHKHELLAYLSNRVIEPLPLDSQHLLAWATTLAESDLKLDEPIKFVEAPRRTVSTVDVSAKAAHYLATINYARLLQETGGWGRFGPVWWRGREAEAFGALKALRKALEILQ